jgi:flavin reductase (DIM6/NTAB) family NADH-FMN oxidoreductase RutF
VVYIFIRPQRHTLGFVQNKSHFTLSFFGEEHRSALQLLGTRSGRDGDKVAASGLTPCFTESGNPTFEEATLVMECRKLYDGSLRAEDFVVDNLRDVVYPEGDFHRVFVGEIVGCWEG